VKLVEAMVKALLEDWERDGQAGSVHCCDPKLPHFSFNPTAVWTAPRGLAMWGELKLRGGNYFVAALRGCGNSKRM